MKHQKKPVIIDAIQFLGTRDSLFEIQAGFPGILIESQYFEGDKNNIPHFGMKTLEGIMTCTAGDFVIKDVKGEFYPCKPDIFEMSYIPAPAGYDNANLNLSVPSKTLGNTTASQAKDNVKDIKFWGDGDTFKLISKASSKNEGWMKSTKAMYIPDSGCVIQVTTQQGQNVAESVSFVPGTKIQEHTDRDGTVVARKIVAVTEPISVTIG